MAEKRLLLLETNFDIAKIYADLLKESVWKIEHKDSLNAFLVAMKEDAFDVAIIEGGIVPDKIISMIVASKPVIICSDNKTMVENITTIPRRFSGSELVNALGKVSFMKVSGNAVSLEDEDYLIEKTISGEEAVLLEPAIDGEEEAELLTPEEDPEPIRSSWEITDNQEEETAQMEAETLVDEDLLAVNETEKEEGQKKEDIFEKIDEIDSIIMSLNKDVTDKKEEVKIDERSFEESVSNTSDAFGQSDESADFLFDDDYKYEDKKEKAPKEEENRSGRISDFESILSDESEGEEAKSEESPIELKQEYESEVETVEALKEDSPEAEPVTELVPEPVAEPLAEPVAEPEVEAVAEPVAELVPESIEEPIAEFVPEPEADVAQNGPDDDMLKAEFRKWLDENARSIIKEVVQEQLKELYGKK